MQLNFNIKKPNTIITLVCLLVLLGSSSLIWVLTQRSAAVTESPVNDETTPVVATETEEKQPFFLAEELEAVTVLIEEQGYLIIASEVDQLNHTMFFTVVPTEPNQDFSELITTVETEIWHRFGWQFVGKLTTNNLGANIEISIGDLSGQLQIKQLTPRVQINRTAPLLAIVIDDWGYSARNAEPFLNYPFPLTTAIIPYLAHSVSLAQQAAEYGHEVILHQPMEALNSYLDLGKGSILTTMEPEEIRSQLQANLAHLPVIRGVNNHMGSKVTADSAIMQIVLEELNNHNLYFLDSHTTSLSVVAETAKTVGIPYAVNDLFIDNVNEVEPIKTQLRKVMQWAIRDGSAIAIGHVRPATAQALWEMIPEFVAAGINLVPVSQLLHYPDTFVSVDNHLDLENGPTADF